VLTTADPQELVMSRIGLVLLVILALCPDPAKLIPSVEEPEPPAQTRVRVAAAHVGLGSHGRACRAH
jgi:hypothetical protein